VSLWFSYREESMEPLSPDESQELERLRRILLMRGKTMLLGAIVGNLIHDLNNPLTTICGNIELLQLTEASQDPKVKKRLNAMQSSSKRLTDKLRSVQLFTKTGRAGDLFDLNEVAGYTVSVVELLYKPLTVPLKTELAGQPLMVTGNPNQVAMALLSLVKNGLDAVVDIPNPRIIISTKRSASNRHSIAVCNNGPQICDELAEKIFEPFFTTKQDSPGIGLSIARELIEENQGLIDWHSTPEQTEFIITLPRAEK
jgi:signal transduction histidine kinase